MGKAKNNKDKTYELTDKEFNLLKLINLALLYSTLRDKIISGMLYQICHLRFGYSEDVNLIFEIDLDKEKGTLTVKEVPTDVIEKAIEHSPQV